MQYSISKAKSAEYLRLAIQHMVRQEAALHPVSYALWYEYVTGKHQRLMAAVDAQLAETAVLDEASTFRLFEAHIAEANAEAASSMVKQVDTLMQHMQTGTTQTAQQVVAFQSALAQWVSDLQQAEQPQTTVTEALLAHTLEMQQAIQQLQHTLSESTAHIRQLQAEITRAREDSLLDGLTGLVSRQGFERALQDCLTSLAMPETASSQTCVLMADIDHFARVNDSYGHLFGDRVVQSVADILQAACAPTHTAARFDVEEFIVLLPETPLALAEKTAEHIRQQVASLRLKQPLHTAMVNDITVSLGVTTYQHGEAPDALIARAMQAVEASKAKGRNQVTTLKH